MTTAATATRFEDVQEATTAADFAGAAEKLEQQLAEAEVTRARLQEEEASTRRAQAEEAEAEAKRLQLEALELQSSQLGEVRADAQRARADVEHAQQDEREAQGKRKQLEAELEEAIFSGGDLAKAQAALAQQDEQIKLLKLACEGARRRQAAAEKAEYDAETARIAAENRADGDSLVGSWGRRCELFAELRGILAKDAAIKGRVQRRNTTLMNRGRSDLMLHLQNLVKAPNTPAPQGLHPRSQAAAEDAWLAQKTTALELL